MCFSFGIIFFFFQRQHSSNSKKSIYTNRTERKKPRQQKTWTVEVSIDKPSSLNYTSGLQVASAVKDVSLLLQPEGRDTPALMNYTVRENKGKQ